MGATDNRSRSLEGLDFDGEGVIEFDNTRGRPCPLREAGGSYVQTVPKGVCNILALDDGDVPRILVHPRLNAVTFVYD